MTAPPPAQAGILRAHLGNPDLDEAGADEVRQVLTDTGARARAERLIDTLRVQALAALDTDLLRPGAVAALRELACAIAT